MKVSNLSPTYGLPDCPDPLEVLLDGQQTHEHLDRSVPGVTHYLVLVLLSAAAPGLAVAGGLLRALAHCLRHAEGAGVPAIVSGQEKAPKPTLAFDEVGFPKEILSVLAVRIIDAAQC